MGYLCFYEVTEFDNRVSDLEIDTSHIQSIFARIPVCMLLKASKCIDGESRCRVDRASVKQQIHYDLEANLCAASCHESKLPSEISWVRPFWKVDGCALRAHRVVKAVNKSEFLFADITQAGLTEANIMSLNWVWKHVLCFVDYLLSRRRR